MIADLVLNNSKVYIKGEILECSIAIEEGKYLKIGKQSQMPIADQKFDLHGLLVLPGLIDGHVHLRDEEKAYKEDFTSGTSAAAAGGFTTVLDMPNNQPITNSVKALRNRLELAKRRALVNVGLYTEFPENLADIPRIRREGAIGFKLFMGNQIGGLNLDDDHALTAGFRAAGEADAVVAIHAEDKGQITCSEQQFKKAKRNGVKDFLLAHTEQAEVQAIERVLRVSKDSNAHLHFCHITSKQGLEAVREAKKAGRRVTCEATPNHLLLTSADTAQLGTMAIMAPPLRDKIHREALLSGVIHGDIDTIGSDHAPHTFEEKSVDSVWDVKTGTPGLETTLPLMLTLVEKKMLTFHRLVEVFVEKPAGIYGLTNKGVLEKGKDADLTIINYKKHWTIDASKFKSKAKFSLYNKWEVIGKPVKTFVNGTLIMDEGEIIADPDSGRVIQNRNCENY
ncbi:MAG: dihydroorotase family protein [Nitrososphaerota archaeon]|nr:dihydroorotase family protein [Nitrososphaerota archaeon]